MGWQPLFGKSRELGWSNYSKGNADEGNAPEKRDVSTTREAQASPSALAAVRQTIIEGYIQQDRGQLCQRL